MRDDFYSSFDTPAFLVDRALLKRNLAVLEQVRSRTGAKILLALKGFAMHTSFGLISQTLDGVCASSPHEARLGRETFDKEVHSFAAAFSESDFEEISQYSDHIVFNSAAQYEKFSDRIGQLTGRITFGLRINPEHRETDTELYDPCAPKSRLGITRVNFPDKMPEHISGLHFHTLCEKNADSLERTFRAVEEKFGKYLYECRWLNMGGGHHITREDYDIDLLCRIIEEAEIKYGVEVYLEPGEAVALNTGFLAVTVLDIVDNGGKTAVVDSSAAAHTPDVIEMPYRPHIIGSGIPDEKLYTYRIAGLSCLAGDIFGDYSFDEPLSIGDRLLFTDMAHYSMVKTTTFNGLALPDILYIDSEERSLLHRKRFGYSDFFSRLA